MKKLVLKLVLAASVVFALGCSSDDDDPPAKKNATFSDYRIDGVEKFLTITGIDAKYNGWYLGMNLYLEGNIGFQGACGGANTRMDRVANGQITISLVDYKDILDIIFAEDDPGVAILKPCNNGRYTIQMIFTENPDNLDEMDSQQYMQTQMDSQWCYTGDGTTPTGGCLVAMASGSLPFFELTGVNSSLTLSQFAKPNACTVPANTNDNAAMMEYLKCTMGS